MITKRSVIKDSISKAHGCSKNSICLECERKFVIIDEMDNSNIPVGYWLLTMKDFVGSSVLKEKVEKYIEELRNKYELGHSICLSGSQGTGKTMSAICILRAAIKQGFSVYYTTAADMLSEMTDFKNSHEIKNKFRNSDFLVIDELDSRFFVSDAMKELFSSIYETIFRHRAHNMLPTIICTNETEDVLNVFYGQAKQSIRSLNSKYLEHWPVAGKDFRKG